MSVCDGCPDPGRCCRVIRLNSGTWMQGTTGLEALVAIATHEWDDGEMFDYAHPFVPLVADSQGRWSWWCVNLTRDGRCGDYEHRPHACRSFVAGMETPCAVTENALLDPLAVPRLTWAGVSRAQP